jgi:hypothetical protein
VYEVLALRKATLSGITGKAIRQGQPGVPYQAGEGGRKCDKNYINVGQRFSIQHTFFKMPTELEEVSLKNTIFAEHI